jgi:hypothetical protein
MTSFQVKVLQKKFTLLHAHFSKIVLKYSNEVHLLRYLTPLYLKHEYRSVLSDIKREAQASVLYMIKHDNECFE